MNAEEILKKIDSLPSGGLTTKTIRGKAYTYYQWTENGKQRSRIVKEDEHEYLKQQIEERKSLQTQLSNLEIHKNLDTSESQEEAPRSSTMSFPMWSLYTEVAPRMRLSENLKSCIQAASNRSSSLMGTNTLMTAPTTLRAGTRSIGREHR